MVYKIEGGLMPRPSAAPEGHANGHLHSFGWGHSATNFERTSSSENNTKNISVERSTQA
jgi:hypothetical protein